MIRRTLIVSLVVCVLVMVPGCSPDESLSVRQSDLEQFSRAPGYHRETMQLSNGRTMPVFTSMPAVGETSVRPLVIALHGGGLNVAYQGETLVRSIVAPGLEALAPIVVAPDLMFDAWARPDGADVIASIRDAALDAWPVDPGRVILTGYSAGGIGSWYMAAEGLDGIAAVIPMAADPIAGDNAARIRLPIFHIHGEADAQFPIGAVRSEIEALQAAGVPVTLRTVPAAGHADMAAYRTAMEDAATWVGTLW